MRYRAASPMAAADPTILDVTRYWDGVADRYLALFRDELAGKPLDLQLLGTFAERVGPGGRVCDAGCGPCGHVTRYLADRGLDVVGVDLSARCVELARVEQPSLHFERMDMRSLAFPDGALDGLVAYYVTHYQPSATLPALLGEFLRVLRPGGQLLVVAKAGRGEGWIEDPLGGGTPVFWSAGTEQELVAAVETAGFSVTLRGQRSPQADEIAADRIYVAAERPG
jgi:SAM-dependent methyltransferase